MDTKQIKPKTVVVVKRKWHNPEVSAYITTEEVGSKMQLNDFLRALTEEVYGKRSRFYVLSKSEFLDKALVATDTIQADMKETTAHVV
jgi:hypothetical protein